MIRFKKIIIAYARVEDLPVRDSNNNMNYILRCSLLQILDELSIYPNKIVNFFDEWLPENFKSFSIKPY